LSQENISLSLSQKSLSQPLSALGTSQQAVPNFLAFEIKEAKESTRGSTILKEKEGEKAEELSNRKRCISLNSNSQPFRPSGPPGIALNISQKLDEVLKKR
jgi:hypothetical protein